MNTENKSSRLTLHIRLPVTTFDWSDIRADFPSRLEDTHVKWNDAHSHPTPGSSAIALRNERRVVTSWRHHVIHLKYLKNMIHLKYLKNFSLFRDMTSNARYNTINAIEYRKIDNHALHTSIFYNNYSIQLSNASKFKIFLTENNLSYWYSWIWYD